MDELTRFARILMERLTARPGGVERPVSVAAVRKEVLPYQVERRALGFSSVEDYETVLLRLVAEERGLVRTSPGTAAERCREVLAQPNPDLGVLEEIADSLIQVTSLAAAPTQLAEAPVAPAPRPVPQAAEPRPPAALCRECRKALPPGRPVVFCPWCGTRLLPPTCARCGSEFDPAWRHCITCGAPVSDPYSSR